MDRSEGIEQETQEVEPLVHHDGSKVVFGLPSVPDDPAVSFALLEPRNQDAILYEQTNPPNS